MKKYSILALVLITSISLSAKDILSGYVYLDSNQNGIMDAGEKGIGGVLVSNQENIVVTDDAGKYEISTKTNSHVFVIKPAEYAFSTKSLNDWQYYTDISKTNGTHNFGLVSQEVNDKFSILVVGDPQMKGEKPLNVFKEDIVTEMMNYNVDFAFILGDIADNDLSIYQAEKDIVNQLPYPAFHLFGNHDLNEKASSAKDASDVFRSWYGPDYYSFNHGKVHFVVLNNVLYEAWNKAENKRGNYFGGLTDAEYNWLKIDLQYVDKNQLVVVMSHIPFLKDYTYPDEIKRLFDLLSARSHLLALSGHLHTIENYFFDKNNGWNSEYSFQNITVGAACGSWWTGPMDERGLPVSTSTDGSPNGYYKFDFEGYNYQYAFIPANHRSDFQMRITLSEDQLYANRLKDEYASINIFTATSKADVKVWLDNKTELMASNYRGIDLFIEKTYDLRYNYDKWRPGLEKTNHLWKLDLPVNLAKGNHSLKVVATDVDGNTYTGYKIFEIK